jgi:histo-blood group ABO system transferase
MNKIGLLIICTNKYLSFLENLIKSADNNFLKNQDVTYFVFTNKDVNVESKRNIITIPVEHKEWPWMTLGRYKIFSENSDSLSEMDYLFYCDVDMLFVNEIGDEILGDLVGTLHHGYYGVSKSGLSGTIESNQNSLAYINPESIERYFAGGFNGGKSDRFLTMAKVLSSNIETDFNNGIIAVWHDETHLNKYFVDNKPEIILSPSYCYYENSGDNRFEQKLVALIKKHDEIRND